MRLLIVLVALIALPAGLTLPTVSQAGDVMISVDKTIKAKKLEKTVVGTWMVYPAQDPELGEFLTALASLADIPVKDLVASYRFGPDLAARLQAARDESPAAPPPDVAAMIREGILLTFEADGTLAGTMATESKKGTWTVQNRADNVLTVTLTPGNGTFDLHFIDKNRLMMAKHGDDRQVAAARVSQ